MDYFCGNTGHKRHRLLSYCMVNNDYLCYTISLKKAFWDLLPNKTLA